MPSNASSAPIGICSRIGAGVETVLHHLHDVVEVGTRAVHLVDVGHARDTVGVGLAPHRLGLRLDAAHGTEDGDRAVEYAKGTLDLDREVDVARAYR